MMFWSIYKHGISFCLDEKSLQLVICSQGEKLYIYTWLDCALIQHNLPMYCSVSLHNHLPTPLLGWSY